MKNVVTNIICILKFTNYNTDVGIIRLTIDQAIDLDPQKSTVGEYNPYAELYFNKKLVHTTKKIKRSNSPSWNVNIIFCIELMSSVILFICVLTLNTVLPILEGYYRAIRT